jgi:predicted transcriptional regulator
MAILTLEIPDLVARRLEALANLSGQSVEELAAAALDDFAGCLKSRRAILKAWRASAQVPGTGYALADLGWLNGYVGQSVDELLLFEGTDGTIQILGALEQAVRAKNEATGSLKITGVERLLLAVMALWSEVNNGGYKQFFYNSSRRFAPAIVGDLVRIGCMQAADITQRALDALKLSKVNVAAIELAMSAEDKERDRALNRCDIEFQERTDIPERLFAYIKAHQNAIQI